MVYIPTRTDIGSRALAATLEWRKASREQAKLGADNYFHHTPEKAKLFKESSKHLRKLHKKMNELLDLIEADMLANGETVRDYEQ